MSCRRSQTGDLISDLTAVQSLEVRCEMAVGTAVVSVAVMPSHNRYDAPYTDSVALTLRRFLRHVALGRCCRGIVNAVHRTRRVARTHIDPRRKPDTGRAYSGVYTQISVVYG